MRELELKWQVPDAIRPALRQELIRRGAKSSRLVARYFDTPQGLLAQHGVSLRLRKEGRRWFQTLKAGGTSAVDRLEHEVPRTAAAGAQPALDLSLHDETSAGKVLRDALQGAAGETLVQRFETDVQRLAVRFQWPDSELEAALDVGHVRAGEREAPILELELEHLAGGLDELFELAQAWQAHGQLWLDTRSKAKRGAALADGHMQGAPIKARAPLLDRDMSGHDLLRSVVTQALEQVLGNASHVAAGSHEEEHVHQLRVGLRRLRTALRDLGSLGHGIESTWEAVLAQAFARLGGIRDDDAVAAAVRGLLQQAGAPSLSWPAEAADKDSGAIVREQQFQRTLLEILKWTLTPAPPDAASACPPSHLRQHLAGRLDKLHRQVIKGGRAFEPLPTEGQHRVRKRLKRLRYLVEFVSALWPPKATRRFLKRMEPAQDALGHHNDVVVAAEKFKADMQRDPQSSFAAGFLVAHRAVTARAARIALDKMMDATRFWGQ